MTIANITMPKEVVDYLIDNGVMNEDEIFTQLEDADKEFIQKLIKAVQIHINSDT